MIVSKGKLTLGNIQSKAEGEKSYEKGNSSRNTSLNSDMHQLRYNLRSGIHSQGNQSRYLFKLPPILHRQTKICSS